MWYVTFVPGLNEIGYCVSQKWRITDRRTNAQSILQCYPLRETKNWEGILPWQVIPSTFSVYPLLQSQVKFPTVFTQTCSQLSVWATHSSISIKINDQSLNSSFYSTHCTTRSMSLKILHHSPITISTFAYIITNRYE